MESIRFDDDETQPSFGATGAEEASLGNRPAAGARQATPDQVFGASDGSGLDGEDFLGLGEEMGIEEMDLGPEPPAEPGAAALMALEEDEPQLFDLDQAEGEAAVEGVPVAAESAVDLDLLEPDPERAGDE